MSLKSDLQSAGIGTIDCNDKGDIPNSGILERLAVVYFPKHPARRVEKYADYVAGTAGLGVFPFAPLFLVYML
ncbi:MAG TPA: hypothetical protein VGP13_03330, partial [Candidatus Paceibacterota bacterium]|nr:hypothetical protein [Candidatus Paceibacterota bacterium]